MTGRRYSYGDTHQLCRRFAASLRLACLQPGDTLLIMMPNTAEWPIVLLGAMEAGLHVSTANPHYTAGKYTDIALSTFGCYGKIVLGEMTSRIVRTQICSVAYRRKGLTD